MTLPKGTALGPYEIDQLLGAGGMGEVYRARDTRLDRTVAIKVLRSDLTAGSEHRARFEREARAISALSNPHICALYDVGRAGDAEYLVMEYLDGETLAGKLARGPLPLSQVLRYGAQIAEALQHAHRAGITHRDLKPGNIIVGASGVKLLDFGLAKLAAQPRLFSDESAPATAVNPITAEGTIVGTVMYMSPEQLQGKPIDHRSDIFSLGCVLYEMVTAQRAFPGTSQASVIAAILSADPLSVRSLQPGCPAALERIILTALEKDPDDRWQTAHDVARQLKWLAESSTSTETIHSVPAAPRRGFIGLAIAAAIGGLIAWGASRYFVASVNAPPLTRLDLAFPTDLTSIRSPETPNFALSPDGRTLCFAAAHGADRALYLRNLDSYDATKLEATANGSGPFWSSDGKWIGFSAHGKLWKTKVSGHDVAEPLCEVADAGAIASWVGGTILFADRSGGRTEIYRVSDQGGVVTRVTTHNKDDWRHTWPHLLPDGKHFLYSVGTAGTLDRRLMFASLDSPESRVLLRNISQATFVASDRLVYVRDARLLAQRIDLEKGAMIGEPSLVADDVSYFYPPARGDFDAANGAIIFRTDTSTGRLLVTDRKGTRRIIDEHGPFQDLSLGVSNDGRRAAVTVLDRATGLGDIWIYDLARGVRDRFTNEPGLALTPIWAPDDRSIVYSTAAAGSLPNLVRRAVGSSTSEQLLPDHGFQFAGSYLPDATAVYFTWTFPKTGTDIFRIDLRTRKSEPVLNSAFYESDPQVSPDGTWLAFVSDASGVGEVYLQSLADAGAARVRVSTHGGSLPRWRRDANELFYLSSQNDVMSVTPRAGHDWSDPAVTPLFRAPEETLRFASAPDGQSFLFIEGSPGPRDSMLHLILGWR
ncbi:MAG: eukaryotic-like serine/threonine-protein kinase [Acidobacteriota bacterium]|nr:eukaryotic-like serine/threonine-protein kinase [Acidobacteriota bacterium]